MISVAEALERLFALVQPLPTESVPLTEAAGRVMPAPVTALRDQPPFAASAMDGYAMHAADAVPGASLAIMGEAAAGRRFAGTVARGAAVRIMTGAPLPEGLDHVVIQEDCTRHDNRLTLGPTLGQGHNIRPAGGDFRAGATLAGPRRLTPADIALMAAMNHPRVTVTRRPVVAILATGDELVAPGSTPGPDQIIASNSYGLHALLRAAGALPRLLPIAGDTMASLAAAFALARDADLILTIGGASVGDHDLVAAAAAEAGVEQSFYKVAMRPGKPLMAGRIGARGTAMIGLPGNPVSAMVCGHVFVLPVIAAMLGLPATPARRSTAPLATALAPNGPREHYLRAQRGPAGVTAFDKQDSSLLTLLAAADCLIVQPPDHPGGAIGDMVEILPL